MLDMFAGVGPFAIALAPRAALVVAVDLNPQAALLMIENIEERVKNVLPLLADARRLERILPWKFDRIGDEPPACRDSIFTGSVPASFQPGGTIHFYSLVSAEGGAPPGSYGEWAGHP